jgi:hypothetical protein
MTAYARQDSAVSQASSKAMPLSREEAFAALDAKLAKLDAEAAQVQASQHSAQVSQFADFDKSSEAAQSDEECEEEEDLRAQEIIHLESERRHLAQEVSILHNQLMQREHALRQANDKIVYNNSAEGIAQAANQLAQMHDQLNDLREKHEVALDQNRKELEALVVQHHNQLHTEKNDHDSRLNAEREEFDNRLNAEKINHENRIAKLQANIHELEASIADRKNAFNHHNALALEATRLHNEVTDRNEKHIAEAQEMIAELEEMTGKLSLQKDSLSVKIQRESDNLTRLREEVGSTAKALQSMRKESTKLHQEGIAKLEQEKAPIIAEYKTEAVAQIRHELEISQNCLGHFSEIFSGLSIENTTKNWIDLKVELVQRESNETDEAFSARQKAARANAEKEISAKFSALNALLELMSNSKDALNDFSKHSTLELVGRMDVHSDSESESGNEDNGHFGGSSSAVPEALRGQSNAALDNSRGQRSSSQEARSNLAARGQAQGRQLRK